jgi:hypothetical protein
MIELNRLKSGQLICKLHGSLNQISSIYKFLGYDEETSIVLMQKFGTKNEIKICRMHWKQEEWTLFPKKFLKWTKSSSKSPQEIEQKQTGDITAGQEGTGNMTPEKFFGKLRKEDTEEVKESQKEFQKNKKPIPQIQAPDLPEPPTEEGLGSGGNGHWV